MVANHQGGWHQGRVRSIIRRNAPAPCPLRRYHDAVLARSWLLLTLAARHFELPLANAIELPQ